MVKEKKTDVKVIRGGLLIDGTGAEPIDGARVLVEGSRIKAVGKDIPIPEGAQVINAVGKTVMPGLIDSHLHLWGIRTGEAIERVMRPYELRLIKSIFDAKALLSMGYTTVKDCGGLNAIFLKKAAAEGTLTGLPRIIASGYLLSQTYGHGDMHYFPTEYVDARSTKLHTNFKLLCDGVEQCIKATRFAMREGADFIKVCTTGGMGSERDNPSQVQFNLDEIRAIVRAAAQAGRFVTTHCEGSLAAAKQSILGGIKTIDHAFVVDDECIAMAKEQGTIFVSTLELVRGLSSGDQPEALEMAHKARPWAKVVIESYKQIHKSGAVLAAGSDCTGRPSFKFGTSAKELEDLVSLCGFTPMDAIVAATKHGAMACFMESQTGTVESGKLADIILIDGNPLVDIKVLQDPKRIRMVMLEGRIEIER
ncbi:MAG: amidohydrolase family protein [Chloroflexi bacterium]|nr:amidohydrolase family protein [Chloroflexota bacterium]